MVRDNYDSEAPFNMAVATLMRLDAILQQIRTLDYSYPFDSPEKQKAYLGLVKQFYINSIPLLRNEDTDKYNYILRLQISRDKKIKSGSQTYSSAFDFNLDYKLNMILVELQQVLKKYFMPKGRDLSKAVARIG